jgi:galactose oxidase
MPKLMLLSGFLLLVISLTADAQTSATGQWGACCLQWPYEMAHANLLSSGKVLVWPAYNSGTNPYIWDPTTSTSTPTPLPGYNIFCAGHTHLADGRVLVAGGQIGGVLYGVPNASIYDPVSNSWTRIPDMGPPRWYPTTTALANGDVLVTSGQIDPARGYVSFPQIWQAATGTWQDLSSAQLILPLYPRTFLAPNGKVFYAGESPQSRYLDTTGTGQWTAVAKTNSTVDRDYGSAVQYGDGKILIMGGGNPPTATAEVIDLNATTPVWRTVAPMASPRRQLNATILPTGQVLVTGGTYGAGFDNGNTPVLAAELWDPTTEKWTTLASQTGARGYHAIALLLPDATVLTAGGDPYLKTAQIFSPPYLFKGARPTISSAPTTVNYGARFSVGTPNASSITQVTWVRLGSVTHAFNEDQRFNRLGFTIASSTGLMVTAPSNPNLAPPGYYMLFVINSAGVPSVAHFVRLNTQKVSPPPVSLAPSSVLLPNTVVNTTSAAVSVGMTNNSTAPLTISNVVKAGDFLQTNNCRSPLAAAATCNFAITFKPTALGLRTGTITITDSAGNSPQIVNLAGNGVLAANTSVTNHNFGKITVGTTAKFSFYLFNNQAVAMNLSSISVSGNFVQTNNCVSPLGAGKYCTITIAFTPSAVASYTGNVTITDGANNSPQVVTLSGSGQ